MTLLTEPFSLFRSLNIAVLITNKKPGEIVFHHFLSLCLWFAQRQSETVDVYFAHQSNKCYQIIIVELDVKMQRETLGFLN